MQKYSLYSVKEVQNTIEVQKGPMQVKECSQSLIKAANEAEAEKYEEQLRNVQKKMQVFVFNFSNIAIIAIKDIVMMNINIVP